MFKIKAKTFVRAHKWEIIILGVLVILSCILNFYNIPDRYHFGYDSTADVIVGAKGAEKLQIPLTGNFSANGPFTFGPWYYYHLIGFHLLTGLPYATFMVNGVLVVLTTVVMYLLGVAIKDRKLGLIIAAISTLSPLVIMIGTSSSNPNIVYFYTAVSYLAFVMLLTKKVSLWWAFFCGVSLGIAMNAHYQALSLGIMPAVLFVASKHRKILSGFIAFVGIGISFVPLIFFNGMNNWHTVRSFWGYMFPEHERIFVPNSWTIYLTKFWPDALSQTFGIPLATTFVFVGIVSIVTLYSLYKKQINKPLLVLGILLFVELVYLRYFFGERHVVYLFFLFPLLFLFVGHSIYVVSNVRYGKIIAGVLLLTLLFFEGRDSFQRFSMISNYSLYVSEAKAIQKKYNNTPVSIVVCQFGDPTRGNAIAYLLERDGMLTENPKIRLAPDSGNCKFPGHELAASQSAEYLRPLYPIEDSINLYDFSSATPAAVLEAGWGVTTPERVYNSEIRWWFDEKP